MRALRLAATAVLMVWLGGCAFPYVGVTTSPPELAVLQGESVQTVVTTGEPRCSTDPDALPCDDIDGRLLDFDIVGAPPGLTVTLDRSLQTENTEGLVRLSISAAADLAPMSYWLAVHATLAGAVIGSTALEVTVLALGSDPPREAVGVRAGADTSFAAVSDGSALSWGHGSVGELASGERRSRDLPGPLLDLSEIRDIEVGDGPLSARVAAVTADGRVWFWATNEDPRALRAAAPVLLRPEPHPDLVDVADVAVGRGHWLVLTGDGRVHAWGRNGAGQLGLGDLLDRDEPTPVTGLPLVDAVAAGTNFSLALDRSGRVWSWGFAGEGRLGRGDPLAGAALDPAPIPGLDGVRAVAAGADFGLALRDDGTVVAWGGNDQGQLGDGTQVSSVVPVVVLGLTEATAIDAGLAFGLALRSDGVLWGWGSDAAGQIQLAQESRIATRAAPLPGLPPGLVAMAAGESHTLALSQCGQVWSQGRGESGQRGDGASDVFYDEAPGLVDGLGRAGACASVPVRIEVAGTGAAGTRVLASLESPLCPGSRGCEPGKTQVADRGMPYSLRAIPGPAAQFREWRGDCAGADPAITVVFDAPAVCVAIVDSTAPAAVLLGVSSSGGRVISSPANGRLGPDAIDCGSQCNAIFEQDETVSLSATADPGHEFLGWAGDCTGTVPDIEVLMTQSLYCDARFRAFELSVGVSGEGRVTSTPEGIACPEASCLVEPGVGEVALTASPAPGWRLQSWSGDCAGATPRILVSMTTDRACTATFERDPTQRFLQLEVLAGAGSVQSAPAGIDACRGTCQALLPTGAAVTLIATPDPGQELVAWFGDCSSPDLAAGIVMDVDRACAVAFQDINDPAFPVANFISQPTFPRVGEVVQFDASGSYVIDPDVNIPDPLGIIEMEWDFGFDGIVDVAGGRRQVTVVQRVFQAPGIVPVRLRVTGGNSGPGGSPGQAFAQRDINVLPEQGQLRNLSVSKAGTGTGRIDSSPVGVISCREGCQAAGPIAITLDAPVVLQAIPSSDSAFSGWSGDCSGTASFAGVTMSAARHCVATFERVEAQLSVSVSGSGSVVGAGLNCTAACVRNVSLGSTVTLDAVADPGSEFVGWSGCDQVIGSQCVLTVNVDRSVSALFGPQRVNLEVGATGSGRVVSNPPGIFCGEDCSERYVVGTVVELVAEPDPGFRFISWSQSCLGSPSPTVTLTMSSDVICTANFAPIPTGVTLTLEMRGFAPGLIVAEEPAQSLSCSAAVCTVDYPQASAVRLRAVPVVGTFFVGWAQGCDAVVNNECVFTMSGDRTVVAIYE